MVKSNDLGFICSRCHTSRPNFRELIEHYHEKHPEILRRYSIKNKRLKQTLLAHSDDNPVILCKVNRWAIKDCFISEVK